MQLWRKYHDCQICKHPAIFSKTASADLSFRLSISQSSHFLCFKAKTWSFPDTNRVVFVRKHNQTIKNRLFTSCICQIRQELEIIWSLLNIKQKISTLQIEDVVLRTSIQVRENMLNWEKEKLEETSGALSQDGQTCNRCVMSRTEQQNHSLQNCIDRNLIQ